MILSSSTGNCKPYPPNNRCGHNPVKPSEFQPPKDHRLRPKILVTFIKRVSRFYHHPDLFPELNAINESDRQMRSERREAICSTLSVCIHYLDLVTLQVGYPRGEEFAGISLDYIAQLAGMGVRRIQRAIADLKAAGWIKVYEIREQVEPGKFIGRAAIRLIPETVFDFFGMKRWLRYEQRKAVERKRLHDERKAKKAKRRLIKSVMLRLGGNGERGQQAKPRDAALQVERFCKLKKRLPDWPDEALWEIVDKERLPP